MAAEVGSTVEASASTVEVSASTVGSAALVALVRALRSVSVGRLGAGLTTPPTTIRPRQFITHRHRSIMRRRRPGMRRRKVIHLRVTRPRVTHLRATLKVTRLLRSAMCRRLRAIHNRRTIGRRIIEDAPRPGRSLRAAPRRRRGSLARAIAAHPETGVERHLLAVNPFRGGAVVTPGSLSIRLGCRP
jgi:hypothetical protein